MFEELEKISEKPEPFEFYNAADLWTDEHISKQMLCYHLNGDVDVSSRNAGFIKRSVDWIATEFNIGSGSAVADFGCGPGLYTASLAKLGADVTGIDFSARSIQYARDVAAREHLDINYVEQNYLEFDPRERFDLVLMIMCDFCALSPKQRKVILGIFHRTLKPGGSVLLDVYSLEAFRQREETAEFGLIPHDGFWSPNRYYSFLNTFKYPDEKVVLDKYTIIQSDRTRTVYNWLQYFSPDDIEREFEDADLTITEFYSNVAGVHFDPDLTEFAVVATRLPVKGSE